ncbi:hypothetical protein CARUB_v10024437mg [Capsella rubella]|uniref:Uncharacterized protein n=1 Tax=Capsella rubella TaxID=81985 RepID=R0HF22_9BRAS|nr:uncharacterized protein LOC17889184 [Capsella rubella]EOA28243.1 hypothetical protein CARUB_v10024437mg [Capsella rubella]EOA28244.1 hypothetical protein CARUB_v10024437mg [Capsella rubella]
MESPATKSSTARSVELPPRRGKVKREIFGFLAGSIVSAAAKAGGAFGMNLGSGGGGGGSSSSTASTPPGSGYTSDQNNEST